MAQKSDIRKWLERRDEKCTHMLVVVDAFNCDEFPSFVKEGQDVYISIQVFQHKEMLRVIEVYNLSCNLEEQINNRFCFNI